MTALTADRNTAYKPTTDLLRIPMAADAVIYVGGMVCRDADGYAVAADDADGYLFAGVAVEDPTHPGVTYDNTGGDDGDLSVVVRTIGRFRYKLNRTPSQDMLFAKVYVVDDQTVEVWAGAVTYDVRCGHITMLPGWLLGTYDAEADMDADEVEIQLSGDPFDWAPTTTTAAVTTTSQGG